MSSCNFPDNSFMNKSENMKIDTILLNTYCFMKSNDLCLIDETTCNKDYSFIQPYIDSYNSTFSIDNFPRVWASSKLANSEWTVLDSISNIPESNLNIDFSDNSVLSVKSGTSQINSYSKLALNDYSSTLFPLYSQELTDSTITISPLRCSDETPVVVFIYYSSEFSGTINCFGTEFNIKENVKNGLLIYNLIKAGSLRENYFLKTIQASSSVSMKKIEIYCRNLSNKSVNSLLTCKFIVNAQKNTDNLSSISIPPVVFKDYPNYDGFAVLRYTNGTGIIKVGFDGSNHTLNKDNITTLIYPTDFNTFKQNINITKISNSVSFNLIELSFYVFINNMLDAAPITKDITSEITKDVIMSGRYKYKLDKINAMNISGTYNNFVIVPDLSVDNVKVYENFSYTPAVGSNFPNNDIGVARTNQTVSSCLNICTNDPNCKGVTMVGNTCYLKSNMVGQSYTSDKTIKSFIKNDGNYGVLPKSNFTKYPLNVTNTNIDNCKNMCNNTTGCAGFSFNSQTNSCNLQSRLIEGNYSDTNFTSYIKNPPGYTTFIDTDTSGTDFKVILNSNVDDCVRECTNNPDCNVAVLATDTPTCYLKNRMNSNRQYANSRRVTYAKNPNGYTIIPFTNLQGTNATTARITSGNCQNICDNLETCMGYDFYNDESTNIGVCEIKTSITGIETLDDKSMAFVKTTIPTKILNNTSYEVSASSQKTLYEPINSFEVGNSYWNSLDTFRNNVYVGNAVTNTLKGEWVQIKLPNPVIVNGYSLLCPSDENRNGVLVDGRTMAPRKLTLFGSDDGKTWTSLHAIDNLSWIAPNLERKSFRVSNGNSYLYYRLVIDKNGGDSSVGLSGLQFSGIIRNDVQLIRVYDKLISKSNESVILNNAFENSAKNVYLYYNGNLTIEDNNGNVEWEINFGDNSEKPSQPSKLKKRLNKQLLVKGQASPNGGKYILKYDPLVDIYSLYVNPLNTVAFASKCIDKNFQGNIPMCQKIYTKYMEQLNTGNIDDFESTDIMVSCFIDKDEILKKMFGESILSANPTVLAQMRQVVACAYDKCVDSRNNYSLLFPRQFISDQKLCPENITICNQNIENKGTLAGNIQSTQNCGNQSCSTENGKGCPLDSACIAGVCTQVCSKDSDCSGSGPGYTCDLTQKMCKKSTAPTPPSPSPSPSDMTTEGGNSSFTYILLIILIIAAVGGYYYYKKQSTGKK